MILQDRLEHLRKQCGPHVSAAAKDSVEGICSKIYYISLEYVKRIREKHLAILKENNISGTANLFLLPWSLLLSSLPFFSPFPFGS